MTSMKYANFIMTFILSSIGLTFDAHAYLLEEQQLFTKNKGCFINYLTEKNTNGWYIETNREECDKDGYLSGYHRITIYNAFAKPIEHLSGHFSSGYWTGDSFIKRVKFHRVSDEIGKQKATFDMYNDKKNGIRFIGQMTTQKSNDGTYPAFHVCNPLRIMGVVDDIDRLDDAQYLQLIFNQAIREIRKICPVDEKAMLFLSRSDKPEQSDIAMFVQMDLKTRRHKIVRADEVNVPAIPQVVKSERGKVISHVPPVKLEQAAENISYAEPVSYDSEDDVSVGGLDVDAVTLDNLSAEVLSDLTDDMSSEVDVEIEAEEPKPVVQKNVKPIVEKEKQSQSADKKTEQVSSGKVLQQSHDDASDKETLERNASREAASFFNSSGDLNEPVDFKLSEPRKSRLQPLMAPIDEKRLDKQIAEAGVVDISASQWPLAHIMLLSRVLNSPVLAQTAAHVDRFRMDGTGTIDLPLPIEVRDGYVSNGWHIIKGYYIAYKNNADNSSVGMIRLIDAQKCTTPLCQEKK